MYEDTPHELVHDLMSEAVFGDHPLGRPVIGTADVISSVGRRALTSYHQTMYRGRERRRRGGREPPARRARRHASRSSQSKQGKAPAQGPARAHARSCGRRGRACASSASDTEQYHVCIGAPGIARSDRRRFTASLLDALLGGSASSRLFQEIREKRGMAYSVYTFASQYTDTGLIGFYVGTRAENLADCLEIANEQIAEVAAGKFRKSELERAKENLKGRILLSMESTSNRMSRLGKSLITDTELLSIDRIAAEIDAVDARRGGRARRRAARAREAVRGRDRAERGAVPRRRARGSSPSCRRARRREAQALRSGGKVGSVLGPALEAAGHELVELDGAEAMVDFTAPDAVVANIDAALEAGVPCVVGTTGWDTGAGRPESRGSRSRRLLRAELRDRRGPDDALRGRSVQAHAARGDRRAAPRDQGRRPVRDGQGDRRSDGRRRADPLRPPAGHRGASGSAPLRDRASC